MSETLCRRRRSPNGSISTYQSILLSEMSILAFWIFFETGQKVEDLFVDLRDGYALIALLEALTGERIQKENGFTRFHRIQNVQYCLDFLKKKNIKLVNIRPEDIVEGNGKLTLGLIWTIILNFQVSVIRQRLLMESQHEQQMSGSSIHKSSSSQVPFLFTKLLTCGKWGFSEVFSSKNGFLKLKIDKNGGFGAEIPRKWAILS
ncbi:hypothetical protein B9Z55_003486 [Caenorhabditis nigoni]|uniref:Calponin-homology (CH) domain-containing protein n=1 Tax=Caenorhabditis nigoni TaxID=1611254 RepID=A0A2G5VQX7_9PELO|nr:hypothetical protein B9Z55_003486 [Caenorhabditis nigoni]